MTLEGYQYNSKYPGGKSTCSFFSRSVGSSNWQRSLSSTKSSPGVNVSNRSRIFRRRFLNGLKSKMSIKFKKVNQSHLKSSGKSDVSLSTLRGPVGKITKPQTIASLGMANIRLGS